MAVIFCDVSNKAAGGTRSGTDVAQARSEYDVEYIFRTNSNADGPEVVLRYCQPNSDVRPFLGKEYRLGNDSDPSSICTKISVPKRDRLNPRLWRLTATFTPKAGRQGEQAKTEPGTDGKDTADPTQWLPKMTVKSTQISIPVEEAIYLSGFKGAAAAVCPANTRGCVTNSAFTEYNPPLERELTIKIYTFTQYLGGWLGLSYKKYDDAINSDMVVFAGNLLHFNDTWDPFTARMKNFDGNTQWLNGFFVWERQVEVHVNPMGWDKSVVDRGVLRRCDPRLGDPDGRGGTLSTSDTLPPGVPPVRHIVDENEVPISEPVLFNGDGQPLENPSPGNAVYLKYRPYMNLQPFAPLNLAGGL